MTISRPPKPPPAPATSRATRPVMTDGYEMNSDFVVYRLEEAGATLLALPGTGYSTRLRTSSLEIVRTALEILWLDRGADSPGGSLSREDHPHGRGDELDSVDTG